MQETLLRALLALRRGTRPANVEAWLHAIARNASIDAHRSSVRSHAAPLHEDVVRGGPAVDETVSARDDLHSVLKALEELPERQRQALVSATFGGTSYADIADEQGTTVSAVKALINRARTSLRSAVEAVSPPWVLPIGSTMTPNRGAGGITAAWTSKVAAGVAVSTVSLLAAPSIRLPPLAPAPPAAIAQGLNRLSTAPSPPRAADRPKVTAPSPPRVTYRPKVRNARATHPSIGRTDDRDPRIDANASTVVRACVGGQPLRRYRSASLLRAQNRLPADVAEYTDCAERLAAASRPLWRVRR